jgi:hypothetical protein
MIAQLQADNELAASVGEIAHAGMNDEEQALYEELEKESGGESGTKIQLDDLSESRISAAHKERPTPMPQTPPTISNPPPRQRNEPEAG